MPIDNIPVPPKPGMDQQGQTPILTPPAPLKKAKGKTPEKLKTTATNYKDIIDIRPTYVEAAENTAVFTFGRMNPPTAGHEKLIRKVADVAKQHGTKGHIVLSHSHDDVKNPLPQDVKIKYVSQINHDVHVMGSSKESPSFLHQAKKFYQQGAKTLIMVAGSDRVAEYQKLLNKYNGHPDQFTFDSINVVSAGQRDPDAEGTAGISGTKMREFAKNKDLASFKKGLPKSLQSHAKEIAGHIKEEMEDMELLQYFAEMNDEEIEQVIELELLSEDLINERVMTLMQRRKAGMKMKRLKFRIQRAKKIKRKRMATVDALTRRSRRAARAIIRKRLGGKKGEHYADLSPSEKMQLDKRVDKKQAIINKLATRLMPKVRSAEIVRLKKARSTNEQSINSSFASYLQEVRFDGQAEGGVSWDGQDRTPYIAIAEADIASSKIKALRDQHARAKANLVKKHALDKEKLVVQLSRTKQSQIRKEHHEIAEAVDTMIDALIALEAKAEQAQVDLDTLMVEFVEGYNNPHGKQTPQQGGFAAVNKIIAEMSQGEKEKAETIVKGMKKKMSSFKQKYGKDAESVMYATANKLAQEDIKTFRKELNEKGLWDNIRAKRNRGEKMNPKGHPDAPTAKEINKSQIKEADDKKTAKMAQLARMGLAKKGEIQTMMRALKGGEDSMKNPQLRSQMYSLLNKLVDIVTSDGQIFVKVRQSVQDTKGEAQDVEEMLDLGGRTIIRINEAFKTINIEEDCSCEELIHEAAEYQGKQVTLNKPFRTSAGPKKFSVYVNNEKGNVVKVNFGDPDMEIKRDDPNRRKSFRARHNCSDPGPKWKARYWSCRQWRASAKVDD